ncbi:MAG: hypothetical protein ACFFCW_40420 [Candidatus Hodarchaeota archaeon]
MIEKFDQLVEDFNLTGAIFLKANRGRPTTIKLRFKTKYEPDEEMKAHLGWRKRKDGVWLIGSGAITFLKEIRNSLGNEFGMRDYVDLTLETLNLPQGRGRKSLLAKHRHITSRLKGRPGRKVNWRAAIAESTVARRIISQMVFKALLKQKEGIDLRNHQITPAED